MIFSSFFKKPDYVVFGPHGGIATTMTLPESFNPETDRCPIAILMHGFISKKDLYPLPAIADALAGEGIASIRFDFNAHGRSEGKFINMTIASEIADAKAVLDYARSLPFVKGTALVGHSQGGVVAGMLAGELEGTTGKPDCIALMAPAAVLKDDARQGRCMNARYDASNPPEYVKVLFHKLGREFILAAQRLPIYETSEKYTGKVLILHGRQDKIVPVSYSERYRDSYKDCELRILEKEGHMFNGDKAEVVREVVDFVKKNVTK